MNPAIIVIAYNRIDSLNRLLHSIESADYPKDTDVKLIISIDRAKDNSNVNVKEAAEKFLWSHGDKQVVYREENYGLKKHVLTCGGYSNEYGSVILLEDDLYVSPSYYLYARATLDFSEGKDKIGGISLYDHRLNVHVREPFAALNDGSDNWYFQFASSWGQAFSSDQWNGFWNWFKENDGKDLKDYNMPANVSGWSDKSWLKYYIKYLIETDRYFLYPSISYTTNFAEEGTHARESNCDLQVPLCGRKSDGLFVFRELNESQSVYDAFFENVRLKSVIGRQLDNKSDAEIMIDLYGYRSNAIDAGTIDMLLSPLSLPYKVVKSYGRKLRPADANIFDDIEGKDFFLYDVKTTDAPPGVNKVSKLLYNYRAIKVRDMLSIIASRINKGRS